MDFILNSFPFNMLILRPSHFGHGENNESILNLNLQVTHCPLPGTSIMSRIASLAIVSFFATSKAKFQ